MKSIDNFKNKKIENMQDIYGGDSTKYCNDITTGAVQDVQTYNDAGCLIKYVTNPGLWNWITGDRKVTTYDGNCQPAIRFNPDNLSIEKVTFPKQATD